MRASTVCQQTKAKSQAQQPMRKLGHNTFVHCRRMEMVEAASPIASELDSPVASEADSPRSAISSPAGSSPGSRGSRDSVVAAEEALQRAAAAAAEADSAAAAEPEDSEQQVQSMVSVGAV